MSVSVFSKFYKIKETQQQIQSDGEFLTLPNDTVIEKLTGEEYKKVSINVFDKVEKKYISESDISDNYARLHRPNTFTEINTFQKEIVSNKSLNTKDLNVTNNSKLKNVSASSITSGALTVTKTTMLNGFIVKPMAYTGQVKTFDNINYLNTNEEVEERYTTDMIYPIGTVLQISEHNDKEMTIYNGGTLAGVISNNNENTHNPLLCLKGKAKVLCHGVVKKGQYCIAYKDGKVKGINKKDLTSKNMLDLVGIAIENSANGEVIVKI